MEDKKYGIISFVLLVFSLIFMFITDNIYFKLDSLNLGLFYLSIFLFVLSLILSIIGVIKDKMKRFSVINLVLIFLVVLIGILYINYQINHVWPDAIDAMVKDMMEHWR